MHTLNTTVTPAPDLIALVAKEVLLPDDITFNIDLLVRV